MSAGNLQKMLLGIVMSQNIIVKTLHKNNAINKQEVIDELTYFIKKINIKDPEGNYTTTMNILKNMLSQGDSCPSSPENDPSGTGTDKPDWFQGIFEGGSSQTQGTDDK